MSELGIGVATPEFARAFLMVATPIFAGMILMIWFAFR